MAFAITYASMVLLPGMLQTLFGYNAVWSGLVMSPAGLFSIPTMAVVGYLIGKKVDARWIIVFGAVLMCGGRVLVLADRTWTSSPGQLVWPRVVQQVGTASLFAPLSVAAFVYLPKELRGPAAGIFAALRNEGGSAGTAMGKTLVTRRIPVHTDRLVENLNPFNPAFNDAMQSLQSFFFQVTGDPVGSQTMALEAIDEPAAAAERRHGLPRRLLALRHPVAGPDPAGLPDEAIGRRGGHAHRGGVGPLRARTAHLAVRCSPDSGFKIPNSTFKADSETSRDIMSIPEHTTQIAER